MKNKPAVREAFEDFEREVFEAVPAGGVQDGDAGAFVERDVHCVHDFFPGVDYAFWLWVESSVSTNEVL